VAPRQGHPSGRMSFLLGSGGYRWPDAIIEAAAPRAQNDLVGRRYVVPARSNRGPALPRQLSLKPCPPASNPAVDEPIHVLTLPPPPEMYPGSDLACP